MLRLRRIVVSLPLFAAFLLFVFSSQPAQAKYIGADPPSCETGCLSCCTQRKVATPNSFASETEGTIAETHTGPMVRSAFGPTIIFNLIYNSYNADGSRASINTVLGYGWTHTYNDFLFSQRGDVFRFRGDGRIVQYAFVGNNTYQTSTGYFETLVKDNDASCQIKAPCFDLTTKYQTIYHYESITPMPFMIAGPVVRLVSITDPNKNVTMLHYNVSGNLDTITDTYGRALTLMYDTKNHLISVTDPDNPPRVTNFHYNAGGYLLTSITDPDNFTTTYSYNYLYQITSKVDRDGQTFLLGYQNGLPYSESDGNGGKMYGLTNPLNWATDPMQLAENLMRVYTPSTTTRADGRSNMWQYQYDSHGYPTKITAPDNTYTQYTYDPSTLQVATETDADLHPPTQYTYDPAQGNLLSRTDANGNTTTYTYDSTCNQPLSMTDPQERKTTYTIDAHCNRTSETDPLGGMQSWTYDPHGNVLTYTDKNTHTTTYAYDAHGNRITMTAPPPLDYLTTYTYDGVGNLMSKTDPPPPGGGDETWHYNYDGLNRLMKVIDPQNGASHPTLYSYDNEGDKMADTDQNGHTTSYSYDLRHRLVKVTDATQMHSTSYTYDANDNRLSMTDRNSHTTNYAYDSQNRLTLVTDALGDTTTYNYDAVGNLTKETDANGHATKYPLYDPLNRRQQRIDAASEVTNWVYDRPFGPLPGHPECTGPTLGSNLAIEQGDGNNKVIFYCYDGLDRKIIEIHKQGCSYPSCPYEIDPDDAVTLYAYDANSDLIQMTEPDGVVTTYAYDQLNRRTQMVNVPTGDTTTWAYDGVGNVTCVTAVNKNQTCYAYDSLYRPLKESDSDGAVWTNTYDAVGNLLSRADGDTNTTTYAYDVLNRVMTATDPLVQSTNYTYDFVGNLTKVLDRSNNVSSYAYDAINRRVSITDAQPATTSIQYDKVGNVTQLIDANGGITSFAYDSVNRLMSETYPKDMIHNTFTVSWNYDFVGNVMTRTDQNLQITNYAYSDLYFLTSRSYFPSGSTDTLTYDLSGRVTTGTRTTSMSSWTESFMYDGLNRPVRSVQNGQTISYMYNDPMRTRMLSYPGGRVITEYWDFRPQLQAVNDGGSNAIAQYGYDLADNVTSRTYRNGTVTTYDYDKNNWVCSIQHTFGATLIAGITYAYDNEGNKFYEQKLHQTTDSEAYAYDSVYRLVNYQVGVLTSPADCATKTGISVPVTQTTYTLDKLGNWTQLGITPGGPQTRMHSPSNEITKVSGYPLSSPLTVSSDNNGNTLNDAHNLYCYDEEDRLTMAIGGGTCSAPTSVIAQYQYDAFGRRVSTNAGGATTLYYYDGWRTIEEQSSGGVTQATYVFGNNLDEVLTMDRVGYSTPFYYHQNALWSPLALSDKNGTAVEGYSYDAYGYQTIDLPGADGILWTADDDILPGAKSFVGNPFMFTQQRYDPETGLLYYKNRHYSTFFGRMMSRDPIDYAGSMSLYEYVNSEPTKAVDPYGLKLKIGNQLVDKESPLYQTLVWGEQNPFYQEVLDTMISSNVVFERGSEADLVAELRMREAFVACMRMHAPATGGCQYPRVSGQGESTKAEGWRDNSYQGNNPSAALDAYEAGPSRLGCFGMVNFCMWKALRDALGPEEFDKRFKGKKIVINGNWQDAPIQQGAESRVLLPGNWVQFHNAPKYLITRKEGANRNYMSENAVYEGVVNGTGMFCGFGIPSRTGEEMLQTLLDNWNEGRAENVDPAKELPYKPGQNPSIVGRPNPRFGLPAPKK